MIAFAHESASIAVHRARRRSTKALIAAAIAIPFALSVAQAADGDGQQSFAATQDSYTLVWGIGVVHTPAPVVDPAAANARYSVPLATYTAPQATIVQAPVVVVTPGGNPVQTVPDAYPITSASQPGASAAAPTTQPQTVTPDTLHRPGHVFPPVGAGWVTPNATRPVPDVDGPMSIKGD